MRELADAQRIGRLMDALGRVAREDGRVYFTGGATAVLLGWRSSTIDVDLKLVPEQDAVLRAIPEIKEELRINIELASPADFIPVPDGWEERGIFIDRRGRLSFYHFDLYAQLLAKIERGHQQDLADVREMIARGLVDAERALAYWEKIAPYLYRYPAIHPPSFRQAIRDVLGR
ncbi:MAG: hypothetical protein KatS3mg081_2530 [Gemmatimonadales bacterium]|nr:hypothetical protein HRbin33_01558 [bacterium HR33]GIW53175.1 MAG: hypothetical protein KatS3mg081_2530 [Gemmatimonadales bacterium]